MYEFRPVTDRIASIGQRVRDRTVMVDAERAELVTEAWKANEHVPALIKIPLVTRHICENMTLLMDDDELIVGNKGKFLFGGGMRPEWGMSWICDELREPGLWAPLPGDENDGLLHRKDEGIKLAIPPEEKERLLALEDYWRGRTHTSAVDAWQPDGYEEFALMEVSNYFPGRPIADLPTGHLVAGYHKMINVGYKAIRDQAQEWLDEHEGVLMGDDVEKYLFYKGITIDCDAATTLIKRYAALVAEKAEACTDPDRKAELTTMADGLEWISERPARTFWEALQATIMYQVFMCMECEYPSPAFGRLDQYTWPFLESDLRAGRITLDKAQELVDAFFLKANYFYGAAPPFIAKITGIGNTYQHTTIGGVDPDTGEDATNPVTYMVLETMGRLKLHDPTISLRINANSPDKLWDCAIQTSRLVGGLPLFQNDEVIVPSLQRELGFDLRDARDYGIIGCQEIVGCGTDFPAGNGTHAKAGVYFGVVFMIALNNGTNPINGRSGGLKTGYLYEMKNMDEVHAAVRAQVSHFLKWTISINNYAEHITTRDIPQPSLSMSMLGCMESGRDATAGGCKYNSYGGTATGLATIGDSLTAIKYLCFDKKICSTRELYDAVMANWEGYEELRQRALNEVPHYGNDDPYADEEMAWIVNTYSEICGECYSARSKVYKGGLYGASDHVVQGYQTWATPDGRRTGDPLADATSPGQGRDHNGPTAVFNSTVCFDHGKFMDGIALNLRIHPTALSNDEGCDKLAAMTKTYFEQGGLEVQYNVVDTKTLREAQAHPEEHRDLVVRIAGYSAYFIELTTDQQNDIISRNENMV